MGVGVPGRPDPGVVLSGMYGICIGGRFARERWLVYSHNDHAYAKVRIQDEQGLREFTVSLGALETAQMGLVRAGRSSQGRELFAGAFEGAEYLSTQVYTPSGNSTVLIDLPKRDAAADRMARELVDAIFPCETKRAAHQRPVD